MLKAGAGGYVILYQALISYRNIIRSFRMFDRIFRFHCVYTYGTIFILFLFKNSAVSRDYVDNDPIPVPKRGTVSGYVCSYIAVLC